MPSRSGQAYFNDTFPRVWWLNFLLVDRPTDPGELAAEAELLHTDAGQRHRRIEIPDDAVGESAAPFFRRLGWQVEPLALMAYRGEGERTADTSAVAEVERESLVPFREEIARAQPWAIDEEAVRQVVAAGEVGALDFPPLISGKSSQSISVPPLMSRAACISFPSGVGCRASSLAPKACW